MQKWLKMVKKWEKYHNSEKVVATQNICMTHICTSVKFCVKGAINCRNINSRFQNQTNTTTQKKHVSLMKVFLIFLRILANTTELLVFVFFNTDHLLHL